MLIKYEDDRILIEIKNSNILIIKINRVDKRNAVDSKTAKCLYDVFKEFELDDNLVVAILCGNDNNFSAGADLKEYNNLVKSPLETDIGPMGCTRLKISKPIIAAINGYCVAGGLELALWCDLRICTSNSKFGVFCRRFGVPLIDGGTIRLPRLIGQSRAMDLILTGREVNSKEAFKIGLVNRVIDSTNDSDLIQYAIEFATLISKFPQQTLKADKKSTLQQWSLNQDDALLFEFNNSINSLKTDGLNGSKLFKSGIGKHGNQLLLNSKL